MGLAPCGKKYSKNNQFKISYSLNGIDNNFQNFEQNALFRCAKSNKSKI